MRRFRALVGFPLLLSGSVAVSAEGPDDWKSEANARIERIRKRDAEVLVVDRLGLPVSGASVAVDQTRHRFAFGTAINTNAYANPTYAAFFLENFEWAVFENESKWFMNEKMRDIETYDAADAIVDFCRGHGIPIRGHCLFWAKEEYTPPWCRSLPESELRDEVEERIDHAVAHFEGAFLHWDVNNEMLDGSFFRDRLGPDIEPHMFVRTREIDPDPLLFVNDYSTVECCPGRTQAYIDQIRSLEARGADVQAIGVQGHYWGPSVDAPGTLAGLDQLSVLGLPIWITEYDCANADENARADALESLYRAAFSHPSVEGILMWGFWAGSHWRGADAAIVDEDWTVNAAGRRYQALMAEWTTHAAGATDALGSFALRGTHGSYVVDVVAPEGDPAPVATTLDPGTGTARWMIPLRAGSCFAAEEIADVELARDDVPGGTRLEWRPLPWRPDMAATYDVIRSQDPSSFEAGAVCVASSTSSASTVDAASPAPGSVFYYLVRGEWRCAKGEGPLGSRSDGTARTGVACH